MCRECVDSLLQCQRAVEGESPLIFIDGTLGGGGHSAALLERLQPGDVLLGCDVDPAALETASKRLSHYMDLDTLSEHPLFVPVQSNFCDLHTVIADMTHPVTLEPLVPQDTGVDGILLDLGVSSHQIDTAERGFAFMQDGPLDMRMAGCGGLSAADVCNQFDQAELKRILKVYGDEPRGKRIAQSIIQHRPLSTTNDLVQAVAAVTPSRAKSRRMGRTASLARVFQSLRIVVNQEDAVLEKALTRTCPSLVRPGGRMVILAYHSMEDRYAKRVIRDGSVEWMGTFRQDEKDIYGNYIGTPKPWKGVGKRQKATDKEVEVNPRARSATLRVGERQDTAL
jgi:16S rRNA (cytosine1402-N4)-methyltransferase